MEEGSPGLHRNTVVGRRGHHAHCHAKRVRAQTVQPFHRWGGPPPFMPGATNVLDQSCAGEFRAPLKEPSASSVVVIPVTINTTKDMFDG
jgi:hypothetical protein